MARAEQQKWAKAKSVRGTGTGKRGAGPQRTRRADTFKRLAGQWSTTNVKPVRIEYTHTTLSTLKLQ